MKMSCDVTGAKQLQGYVERTLVRVRLEQKRIVKEQAEKIMAESATEVPVDTSTLLDSAFVEQRANGDVLFGYGSGSGVNPKSHVPATEYMVEVHEDLSKSHPNGGKAKFLEDPVRRNAEKMEVDMAKKIRRAIMRSGGG